MKKSIAIAAMLLTMAAGAAQAVEVRPLVGMGLTVGGDTIADVNYTNGDSAKVHAGGLIAFTGGLELEFTPLVSTQVLVSYHFDRANATNGSVRFERTPIEFLGHFRLNDIFRVGGGARYTSGAKTRASGAASGSVFNEDFKPSWGSVVEGEFTLGRNLGVKLRYVSEKFKSESYPFLSDVDGSHVGVYLIYYFN
ncbi:MAG: outer membrane beta-barrel protein [Rhizobacter sp.]